MCIRDRFYIIPAAVSVLALVHLHRRELRPGVLNATRLAALSALYAGVGLDVFLRPELWVFVLALGLALAGVIPVSYTHLDVYKRQGYWRSPLQWSSTLLYLLALAGALLGGLAGDVRLPVLLALLCLALFPVARPWPNAPAWRGLGLALLSSALAWSLAGWADFAWSTEIWMAVGWGYALWFDGNLLLPRWNARQPGWAVAPEFWPLLGLACVLLGSVLGFTTGVLSLAAALAALTPYLFLLLRNTAWPGIDVYKRQG